MASDDQLLAAAVAALDAPLAILSGKGRILFANAAWSERDHQLPLFGTAFPIGASYIDLCRAAVARVGADAQLLAEGVESLTSGQRDSFVLEYAIEDGSENRWYQARLTRFGEASELRILVTHYDVTELKVAEHALQRGAMFDALTGVPNRMLLLDRVNSAIAGARREARMVAVMIMDLDRFKEVNDNLGHHAGDLVLQQVAQRITEVLRDTDTLGRLGGDEFGVLLTAISQARHINAVAEKVLAVFEEPFKIEDHSVDVGASIGVAIFPDHAQEPDNLLRRADVAMYKAKREGLGYVIYSPDGEDAHGLDRATLMPGLRQAMERDELALRYQPRVLLADHQLVSAATTLEWDHPEFGLLNEEQFSPLAERTGLIKPLTHWTLNATLRQSRVWQEADDHLTVAVRLSPRVLQDPQLPQAVARLLRAYALPPQCLEVDVDAASLASEQVFETVNRLGDLGVKLCLSDFASGYSGMPFLRRLPIHEIALPRAYVANLGQEEEDAAIVRSTVELAHDMGVQVLAFDVDTPEAEERLREVGCDLVQGARVAPAMSLDEFERWRLLEGDHANEASPVAAQSFRKPAVRDESDAGKKPAAELLAQISLFSLLDARDLKELAAVTRVRRCDAGDVIFRKEDPGYTLYLIVSGAVKISDPSPKGGEMILAILRSGQFFGELSLFDDEPRSADAIAVEPTELLALSREDLLKVINRRPSVTVHLFKILSQRIRATNETLREITALSLPGRIAKRLLDLSDLLGERQTDGMLIPLVLGPEEISNMIGAPAGEVERVLESFRFSGLIHWENEGLLLANEQELQSISLG